MQLDDKVFGDFFPAYAHAWKGFDPKSGEFFLYPGELDATD